jgi:hypothetical protein
MKVRGAGLTVPLPAPCHVIGSNSTVSSALNESEVMAERPLTLISMLIPRYTAPSSERIVKGTLKRYRGCRLRSGEISGKSWSSMSVFTRWLLFPS